MLEAHIIQPTLRRFAIAPKPPPEGGKGPRASGESHRNASLRTQKPQGERGRGREFQNMKKSKKLAILGLSAATAAAAATGAVSSFAWFASNDTVTTNSMKIKASSNEVYLQIDKANTWNDTNNAYRTASASVQEATLSPTHAVKSWDDSKKSINIDGTGGMVSYKGDGTETKIPSWVSATSASATESKRDDNPYTDRTATANTVTTSESNNGYTLLNQFYLRLRPAESGVQPSVNKLQASVQWAILPILSSDAISASVRVLLWNTTDKIGTIYTPAKDTSESATVLKQAWTTNDASLIGTSAAWTATTASGYNAKLISVYVYFDGEDAACTSNNIKVDNTYSVNVSFKVTKVAL